MVKFIEKLRLLKVIPFQPDMLFVYGILLRLFAVFTVPYNTLVSSAGSPKKKQKLTDKNRYF